MLYTVVDDDIRKKAAQAVKNNQLLDLKNDAVFKSFFSKDNEESAYCRRRMISAVIGREVTHTQVLNGELLPLRFDGKSPRLDIHCRLDDGSEVDVEMQNSMYEDDQVKRSIYYAAVLTANALKSGEHYTKLSCSYQIMFMNFRLVKDDRSHHIYKLKEASDGTLLSDVFQIHYIELPKIADILKNPTRMLSEVEFWAMLMVIGGDERMQQVLSKMAGRKKDFEVATSLLKTMSKEQREWEIQLSYESGMRDFLAYTAAATEKGLKQGREQGKQEGLQQGSLQARTETAQRMLSRGKYTVQEIAEDTGLPVADVQRLTHA